MKLISHTEAPSTTNNVCVYHVHTLHTHMNTHNTCNTHTPPHTTHHPGPAGLLHAEEHWPQLCQPPPVHCRHTLHVLLTGHDQFVVDNVVWSEAHPVEGAGRVEVAWHPTTQIHILTNALHTGGEQWWTRMSDYFPQAKSTLALGWPPLMNTQCSGMELSDQWPSAMGLSTSP